MKTAIITGAYGAIGKAIAAGIAKSPDYKVIMVGRDSAKLKSAVEDVKRQTGNHNVLEGMLDLSRKRDIEAFARAINEPVHVLVNNASTTTRQRLENNDGIEMQWAVNVLAYFHMISFLTPQLEMAGGARVVNVASYWAGGLDLDNPEFKMRRYNNDSAYRQSKQAERMLTRSLSELLAGKNITVNACHPGDVNSKLSNNLGFGGHQTPEQGADTPVWLAMSNEVEGITGGYFENRRKKYCAFMEEKSSVDSLFKLLNES